MHCTFSCFLSTPSANTMKTMSSVLPMNALGEANEARSPCNSNHASQPVNFMVVCGEQTPSPSHPSGNAERDNSCDNNSHNASGEDISGTIMPCSGRPSGEQAEDIKVFAPATTSATAAATKDVADKSGFPASCAEKRSSNDFSDFLREANTGSTLGGYGSNSSFENSMSCYEANTASRLERTPDAIAVPTSRIAADEDPACSAPDDYIPIDYDAEMADCSQYVFSTRPYCTVVGRGSSSKSNACETLACGTASSCRDGYIPISYDACIEELDALCACGPVVATPVDGTTCHYFTGEDEGDCEDEEDEVSGERTDAFHDRSGSDSGSGKLFCSPISPSYSSPPVGHTPMANFPTTLGGSCCTGPSSPEPFSPAWLRRQQQLRDREVMKTSRLKHARMQEQQNFCGTSLANLSFSIKCFLNEACRQDLRRLSGLPVAFFANAENVQRVLLDTHVSSSLPTTMRSILVASTLLSQDATTVPAAERCGECVPLSCSACGQATAKKAAVLAEVRQRWRALAARVTDELEDPHMFYRDIISAVNVLSLFTHNLPPQKSTRANGCCDGDGSMEDTASTTSTVTSELDGGRTQYVNLSPAHAFAVSGSSIVRQMDSDVTDELRRRRLHRQAALLAQLQSQGTLFVLPTLYAEQMEAATPVAIAESVTEEEEDNALALCELSLSSSHTASASAMLSFVSPMREPLSRPASGLATAGSLSISSGGRKTPAGKSLNSNRASVSTMALSTSLRALTTVASTATPISTLTAASLTTTAAAAALTGHTHPALPGPTSFLGMGSLELESVEGDEEGSQGSWEELPTVFFYPDATRGGSPRNEEEDGIDAEDSTLEGDAFGFATGAHPLSAAATANAECTMRGALVGEVAEDDVVVLDREDCLVPSPRYGSNGGAGAGATLRFRELDLTAVSSRLRCTVHRVFAGNSKTDTGSGWSSSGHCSTPGGDGRSTAHACINVAPLSLRRPCLRGAPQQLSDLFTSTLTAVLPPGCPSPSNTVNSNMRSNGGCDVSTGTMDSPSGSSSCNSGSNSPNVHHGAAELALAGYQGNHSASIGLSTAIVTGTSKVGAITSAASASAVVSAPARVAIIAYSQPTQPPHISVNEEQGYAERVLEDAASPGCEDEESTADGWQCLDDFSRGSSAHNSRGGLLNFGLMYSLDECTSMRVEPVGIPMVALRSGDDEVA